MISKNHKITAFEIDQRISPSQRLSLTYFQIFRFLVFCDSLSFAPILDSERRKENGSSIYHICFLIGRYMDCC